jgi:hypothetical protein
VRRHLLLLFATALAQMPKQTVALPARLAREVPLRDTDQEPLDTERPAKKENDDVGSC